MKILLATNIRGISDEILGELAGESDSIISKETTGDTKELIRSVYKLESSGNFNITVVVPDDHVAASILLNKYQDLRAAVCSSGDDIRLAVKNTANVIILKNTGADKVLSAIREVQELKTGEAGHMQQRQAPQRQVQEQQDDEERAPGFKIAMPELFHKAWKAKQEPEEQQERKRQKAKPAPEPDYEEEVDNSKVKGVFNKLKNSLGIIDQGSEE